MQEKVRKDYIWRGLAGMNLIYIWAPLATLVFTSFTSMGGIGGAFILVPIFYWLGLPMYTAATLGLLMAFFTMCSACIGYQRDRHIKYKMGAVMIVSMLLFSPLASYVSAIVNKNIVLFVFSIFLVVGGSMMFFYHPKHNQGNDTTKNSKKDYVLGFLAGALIGFLSGLLGVGGGILIGPFLLWRGFNGKDVSGTSSFVVLFSASVGFLSHLSFLRYAHVNVNYLLFILVVVAGTTGGIIGSYLARFKLTPIQIKRIIGTFEYAMAVRILAGLVGAVLLANGHG